MRKWMIPGFILVGLGVAAIVAVLNVNSFIKRNKDYLLDQAEQALNRKISVGEAEVTLFRGIGLRVSNFAMSDDPAYSKEDFVRAKDLQINLKFWPLFRKRIEVKRAVLHEPFISILRHANGEFNFSTIGQNERERKPREPKERTPKARSGGFLISIVDISGGDIRYRDEKDGTDLRLQQVDLKLDDLDSGRAFGASLAAALFTPKQNLHVKSRIGPIRPDQSFDQAAVDGEIQIDAIDLGQLRSALPLMKNSLPPDWDLSGIYKIKDLKFKGTVENFALHGELDGTDGSLRIGKSFHKSPGTSLVISTDAQYANKVLVLRQPKIKLHTLDLATKGEIALGNGTQSNLSVSSNTASLDGWDKIIPAIENYHLSGKMDVRGTMHGKMGRGATPQIQGTLNLAGVSAKPPSFAQPIKDLNTTINFTGQKATVRESTFNLGNSRIHLTASVEKFSPLTLSYGMSTPEVRPADFDAQLSSDRKSDIIRNLTSDGQVAMRDDGVSFQGKLASAQGTLYNIPYKNLETKLSLVKKVANIQSLRVNALEGTLQTNGEYAFDQPVPRFSFISKLQGIDVKELYAALSAKAANDIRGKLNGDMKISGSGRKWEEIQPTLRGSGDAEVLQGALLNFNVAEGALSGITGIPGMTNLINPRLRKKYPATFEAKDTEFKELKGQFDLADGRMNIKNLRIAAPDYSVQGNGWVDFNHNIDFRSALMFSPEMSADIAQSAREVKYLFNPQNQLEIPFALKGKLPNVKPKPDTNYLAKAAQRGFFGKGAEELQRRSGTKDSSSAEEAPAGEPKKRKKVSTEEMIRKGLEGFFKR